MRRKFLGTLIGKPNKTWKELDALEREIKQELKERDYKEALRKVVAKNLRATRRLDNWQIVMMLKGE